MKIYDKFGNVRGWDWLVETFGPVEIFCTDTEVEYEVAELHEREADSTLNVFVYDSDGWPVEGMEVAYYWPDAPPDPCAHPQFRRCHLERTNSEGRGGMGMYGGSYYFLPQAGPHSIWLYTCDAPNTRSEIVSGLGMLGGTNHIHLDVVYRPRIQQPEPEPEPEPEPDWFEQVNIKLDYIISLLEECCG